MWNQPLCEQWSYWADGTDAHGVFRSTDNGTNWVPVNNGLPYKTFQYESLTALSSFGTSLFGGAYTGIYRSTDNGDSWAESDNGLSGPFVTAFGASDSAIFVGTISGIFGSTNLGDSWHDVSSGLPDGYVFAITRIGPYLLAGTDHGIWRRPISELTTANYALALIGPINDTVAFGRVPVGSTALRIVSEHNVGKEPLTIQPIQEPRNEFSTSDLSTAVRLDTGESFTVEIYFRPTDTSFRSAVLNLVSETRQDVSIVLTGSGFVPNGVTDSSEFASKIRSYPNPVSKSTTIDFTTETARYASVSIVNALGTEVVRLFSGELSPGEHQFSWDAEKNAIPNGMYDCVVRMNGRVEQAGIVVMR